MVLLEIHAWMSAKGGKVGCDGEGIWVSRVLYARQGVV